MSNQRQFLKVVSVDQAKAAFESHLQLQPLGNEIVPLSESLGRVLDQDIKSRFNVPNFDRSNFDGFAVFAHDTQGATEIEPVRLTPIDQPINAGDDREIEIRPGETVAIATGGRLPRGANAVVLIEDSFVDGNDILVSKSVAPGSGVSFTASDISYGQLVLAAGTYLTSRETGVLAAIGETAVKVCRKPKVAIISTGDELVPPDEELTPAKVFDSNARILCDAVTECGGTPVEYGIAIDDLDELNALVDRALGETDIIVLSGGTSKGQGDLSYQSVRRFDDPGMVVHGVALKPGKPVCLAVSQTKPIVVLPGFPTSAVFTFHQFVAPVIRAFAGIKSKMSPIVRAKLATKINSAIGRTEFNLVGLSRSFFQNVTDVVAHPVGKGSGSVTAYKLADGFFSIEENCEQVEANTEIDVHLLSQDVPIVDLVFAGSHCAGVDLLLSQLQLKNFHCKAFFVGSTAGLQAAKRGHALVAGIHLLDEKSDEYNQPFIGDDQCLIVGYRRQQGIVFRSDDSRLVGKSTDEIVALIKNDDTLVMANRNPGSGTRILIERLLGGKQPAGYWNSVNNHYAAVANVQQARADWTVAISAVSNQTEGVTFVPLAAEHFDFVVAKNNLEIPVIYELKNLLHDSAVQRQLVKLGLEPKS